jgi:hypothetical protein
MIIASPFLYSKFVIVVVLTMLLKLMIVLNVRIAKLSVFLSVRL